MFEFFGTWGGVAVIFVAGAFLISGLWVWLSRRQEVEPDVPEAQEGTIPNDEVISVPTDEVAVPSPGEAELAAMMEKPKITSAEADAVLAKFNGPTAVPEGCIGPSEKAVVDAMPPAPTIAAAGSPCKICGKPVKALGLCSNHYNQQRYKLIGRKSRSKPGRPKKAKRYEAILSAEEIEDGKVVKNV